MALAAACACHRCGAQRESHPILLLLGSNFQIQVKPPIGLNIDSILLQYYKCPLRMPLLRRIRYYYCGKNIKKHKIYHF